MKKISVLSLAMLLCLCIPCTGLAAKQRVVHVTVALCDNVNQGIVPVPAKIGNGEDAANNLYWGAAYGVKSFMRKQPGWGMKAAPVPPGGAVIERLVFTNRALSTVIVADAYRGNAIRAATMDFLSYAAGEKKETVPVEGASVTAGGGADLVVYVGHNGLMDFSLSTLPRGERDNTRRVAIFACQSKAYFATALKTANAYPLIWTRGNMAPEAYSLHALVTAWASGKSGEAIREAVAAAYHKYQKCGMKGARNLFATGW
ncbi:conserved exported hypothetical protein [uncultured delta proteobacterium]|uniref:Uncharacterized protein n=1 Tax=uncultured delta proteobacterium TaxID=34034 RepID=A0A212JKI5_9DELT|nr:conserved exported hypothetical protein [uncultured delta proteobacterium]